MHHFDRRLRVVRRAPAKRSYLSAFRQTVSRAIGLALAFWAGGATAAGSDPPVRVPPGFTVELFAGDDLATDVAAMTLDHRGRVLVAGPGYIKTLHDDDADGRADRATMFAGGPSGGAQGLVVLPQTRGVHVVAAGGDGLLLYRDVDDDGRADQSAQSLITLGGGERGVHGLCHGPAGDLYFVYGNERVDKQHSRVTEGPSLTTEMGAVVLRSSITRTDALGHVIPSLEVLAWGFDNPYDLDFHSSGRLLTADGDRERDLGLPWYAPAKLYDMAWGRDHGRTVAANGQSWTRPDYFFDAVAPAVDLGRAVPTGVAVYRHRQFPERYRGGVFTACWLTGRVYFSPLEVRGSSLGGGKETFLEFTGDAGLAPVDLAVGPEGDLYVACGGRGTPGAVWRVRYTGKKEAVDEAKPVPPKAQNLVELERANMLRDVLTADQPLAAWSRARWVPQALALGKQPFVAAIADKNLPVEQQVRAVEVLAELFSAITLAEARAAVTLGRPELSARIAWLVERQRTAVTWADVAVELTHDRDPRVQLAAWESLRRAGFTFPRLGAPTSDWIGAVKPDVNRRVYDLLVQYALQMPQPPLLVAGTANDDGQRKAYNQFQSREREEFGLYYAPGSSPEEQLRQLRRIQKFYGDYSVGTVTPREIGYRRAGGPKLNPQGDFDWKPRALRDAMMLAFPTGNTAVDRELARTFLVFPIVPEEMLGKFLDRCTPASSPTDGWHYLSVCSVITQLRTPAQTAATADALVRLDAKFAAAGIRPGAHAATRLGELFVALMQRDPALALAVVDAREFGRPAHAVLVAQLPTDLRPLAAQRLVERTLRLPADEIEWTSELIDVFALTRRDDAMARLRELWREPGLRDALTPALLAARDPRDREKFVDRLTGADPDVVARSAVYLRREAKDRDALGELAAAVQGLRQMCTIPDARRARRELLTLIELWGSETFDIVEPENDSVAAHDPATLRNLYQPVLLWFALRHYGASAAAATPGGVDPKAWRKQLLRVDWDEGDAERGRALFERKLCVRCHTGDSRLGPDLDTAPLRYGRAELFATVFEPSRFVPPRYRPTTVELRDGRSYTGIPIADSPDVLLLQTGAETVVRVRGEEIAARRRTTQSIMPLGMLTNCTPQDFADLDAYLRTPAGK